jgi:predicted alpha/beta hydrolase family esterase
MQAMKRAIIVHGKPSREKYEASPTDPSDSHWIPWAKHQMNIAGVATVAPDMPVPYSPDYAAWEAEFDRQQPWKNSPTLIGLSAGASFLLRYMSENSKLEFDKLVLVAPWLDLTGKYGDFSKFRIDTAIPERCIGGLAVFHSSQDDQQALASLDLIQRALPEGDYTDIPGNGHYMLGNTMQTTEFPELLAAVLEQ